MKQLLFKIKTMLNHYAYNLRLWIVIRLFTEDEKYMMVRAIEDRIKNLQTEAVGNNLANVRNIVKDVNDYINLSRFFSTKHLGFLNSNQ